MEKPNEYRVGSPFAPDPLAATSPVPAAVTAAPDAALSDGNSPGDPAASAAGVSRHAAKAAAREPETLGNGVWTETAAAAAYAAVIVLAFAAACLLIFPAGGIAVAALGAVLALLGLSSRRVGLSIVTLVLHGVLFFVCYLRAI